jgi:hypothetical protein
MVRPSFISVRRHIISSNLKSSTHLLAGLPPKSLTTRGSCSPILAIKIEGTFWKISCMGTKKMTRIFFKKLKL